MSASVDPFCIGAVLRARVGECLLVSYLYAFEEIPFHVMGVWMSRHSGFQPFRTTHEIAARVLTVTEGPTGTF